MSLGKKMIHEKLEDFNSRKFVRGENALSNKEVDLIPVFELTEELQANGYVSKPIVGRCGANIQMVNQSKSA